MISLHFRSDGKKNEMKLDDKHVLSQMEQTGPAFSNRSLTNPFLASTLLPLAHSDLAPTLFHTPTFLTTQAILQLLLRYLRNVCAPA
ncbi:hypothetical protein CGMCC3_g15400 [Colletotrichum fructicola]|nr:uncharacterized protein CGMCC3_g15400 [Colletotrichum fructicola]KAE9568445.1 hypothetical protein CGMCC3_g15400 [Colletotrichum fructicola]KAF5508304.1 hypothetical protein CGCF413_v003119 [Colletotrichum fructicola]